MTLLSKVKDPQTARDFAQNYIIAQLDDNRNIDHLERYFLAYREVILRDVKDLVDQWSRRLDEQSGGK